MADIRIKDLATTASSTAADDFLAVDGTTNGTRKLSAATPSFATSVTVPGVSGPTTTNLTLAGGSTGASLVLVQGANAAINITSNGSGSVNVNPGSTGSVNINSASGVGKLAVRTGTNENAHFRTATAIGGTGVGLDMLNDASGATVGFTLRSSATRLTGGNVTVPDGNLLIGTTTDGGQKLQVNGTASFAGAVSTTSTGFSATNASGSVEFIGSRSSTGNGVTVTYKTGATLNWFHGLRGLVDNNWYLFNNGTSTNTLIFDYGTNAATFAGAVTAGGAINVTNGGGTFVANSGSNSNQTALSLTNGGAGGTNYQIQTSTSAGTTAGGLLIYDNTAAGSVMSFAGTSRNVTVHATTSASSSTVGALTIGNGTAATNVAIGGGNINAGGTGTFGGAVAINNTVAAAVSVASTHKVTMVIGGVTYYLLASNV